MGQEWPSMMVETVETSIYYKKTEKDSIPSYYNQFEDSTS